MLARDYDDLAADRAWLAGEQARLAQAARQLDDAFVSLAGHAAACIPPSETLP